MADNATNQKSGVLFVNSFLGVGGGAEVILTSIETKVHSLGIPTHIIVQENKTDRENVTTIDSLSPWRWISKKWRDKFRLAERIRNNFGLHDLFNLWPLALLGRKWKRYSVLNIHNVHGYFFSLLVLPLLSRRFRVVWTLHDYWVTNWKSPYSAPGINEDEYAYPYGISEYPFMKRNSSAWMWPIKKFLLRISKITFVCPSKRLANAVEAAGIVGKDSTTKHVPNGIHIDRFVQLTQQKSREKLHIDPNETVVYMQAGWIVDPRKGILDAISSSTEFDVSEITLIVTGHQSDEVAATYEDNLRRFKRIIFESYIPNNEIPYYFSAADVYGFPSHFENYSTTLLESLSAGTPPVCFNIGGNAEIVDTNENGIVIEPYDYSQWWRVVLQLLTDSERRIKFGTNGKDKATHRFNIDAMVETYLEIFEIE